MAAGPERCFQNNLIVTSKIALCISLVSVGDLPSSLHANLVDFVGVSGSEPSDKLSHREATHLFHPRWAGHHS